MFLGPLSHLRPFLENVCTYVRMYVCMSAIDLVYALTQIQIEIFQPNFIFSVFITNLRVD